MQLAGFTVNHSLTDSMERETVTIEPSEEIVEEAAGWYEEEQPPGDREEVIKQYVLDLTQLEVSLN